MKNQVIKRLKKALAATITVAMLAGLGMVASAKTQPESEVTGSQVVYEKRTDDYAKFMSATANKDRIPKAVTANNNGLIFGGWFVKNAEDKYEPIKEAAEGTGKDVYAKFVPARVLSVKFQNQLNTTSNSNSTDVKIVSSVDSLNYEEVWFDMKVVVLSDDKKTYESDVDMVMDTTAADKTTVYHTLKVNGKTYNPEDVFGQEAVYFATSWVRNVPNANFGSIIYIKPHWKTLDGTIVDGLAKYGHVNDAFGSTDGKRKISVPINVRDFAGVAAGVLQITPPEGATCVDIECGRVFGEMDFAKKTDNSVKLVGNLKTMEKDVTANDIYANVIFEVDGDDTTLIKDKQFTISAVDFANVAETQYTEEEFPVWNINY